jgi:hypothetical protein
MNLKFLHPLLVLIGFFLTLQCHAQPCMDTVYMVKNKCYLNNKKLSQAELNNLFKTFPEAKKAHDKYINTAATNMFISGLAGVAFGYGISPFLFAPSANYNAGIHLTFIGVGLAGYAWGITREEKQQDRLKTAISIYNTQARLGCAK